MNHSKIMLVDDQEGITGSQNIDILSFDFNMESGVFFTEPELISELSQVAEDWKKEATRYSPKIKGIGPVDLLLDFCFIFFEQAVKFFNRITA